MKDLGRREIALAGAVATGLHLALAGLVLRSPASEGATGVGMGGIEISLSGAAGGPALGAAVQAGAAESGLPPDEIAAEEPPPVPPADPPEAVEAEQAKAAPAGSGAELVREVEQVPVEAVPPEPAPVETTRTRPAPLERVVAEPVMADPPPVETAPADTVEPETAEAAPETVEAQELPVMVAATAPAAEPIPETDETAYVAPIPRPKPPVRAREPEPEAQPISPPPEVVRQATREEPPREATAREAAPAPSPAESFGELDSWSQASREPASGPAGGSAAAAPSAGSAGAAGGAGVPASSGSAAERRDFMAEVAAWLNRHKRYPRRARMRGDEGTGVLRFSMDRQGRVISARLERSSGHEDLDEAILEMIRRAEPLPEIPPELGATLEFSVPISFALR